MTDPTADAAKQDDHRAKWTLASGDEMFLVGEDGVGLSAAGHVIVKPLREWHALANTRPQPAPPAGEPDFDAIARRFLEPNYPDIAARSTVALLVRFSHYLKDYCGLAARRNAEDAEVAGILRELRRGVWAHSEKGNNQFSVVPEQAADLLERLAGELAEVTVDRDGWKQQHENLVGVRQTDIANLAAKIDDLKVELDRRKGDPRTRLHNLCEALQEDLDKSPYTREEWEQVDHQLVELQRKLREVEAKLAEREAELQAYRDAAIYDPLMDGPRFKTWNRSQLDRARDITERHAARQQQKASAEPTAREGE